MKTKTLLLAAAGVGAYLLYKRSKAQAATAPAKDTQAVAGALGAVMTGNPMLAELGSLGSDATPPPLTRGENVQATFRRGSMLSRRINSYQLRQW